VFVVCVFHYPLLCSAVKPCFAVVTPFDGVVYLDAWTSQGVCCESYLFLTRNSHCVELLRKFIGLFAYPLGYTRQICIVHVW
jgi:hypothetical protein